ELQSAIDMVERRRATLKAAQPEQKQQARILAMLPRAAGAYLQKIDEGLAGNPRAAAQGRVIVRDMIGEIKLSPGENGSLWATHRRANMAAMLVKAVAGTAGRGDRI
ncbi:MAG TPA: hypothetical protein VN815_14745, partial [Steroidobacteraceae bacterium]|nr:hypothetical protein [Steroidobacteraceae bacterium]